MACGFSGPGRKEGAWWAEVEIEVLQRVAVLGAQIGQSIVEREERGSQFLVLFFREVSRVHAAQRLALDELTQEFDQGEDEFEEVLFHGVTVGVHTVRCAWGCVVRRGRCLNRPEGSRHRVTDVLEARAGVRWRVVARLCRAHQWE